MDIQKVLEDIYKIVKKVKSGKNASYIPELKKVNPNIYGISICLCDGNMYNIGDFDDEVAIESVAKVFTLILALEKKGKEKINNLIGHNSSFLPFNSLLAVELSESHTINPFVNAGAMATTSLLYEKNFWKKIKDNMNNVYINTQNKLIEEIDSGRVEPRLFEVLAQLQSQIMQMPKDYQAYLEKMEQNYKKTRIEIDEKKHSQGIVMDQTLGDNGFYVNNTAVTQDGGIRSRGTRGIMEGLRDIIGSEIVDIKPEVVNPNSVVNAREKKILDSQNQNNKLNFNEEDPGEDFSIEDDILE